MAKKKMTLEETLEDAIVKDVPYEVPENWVWSKLGNISTLVTGNTPSKKNIEYYGESIPFIKPNDLDQGRRLKYSMEMLSSLGAEKARVLPKGSIAVCCIGSIGKTAYLEVEGATNQQINSIIPDVVENLYIYYYVLSEYFQRELISNSSATTISIINKSKMGELAVPLAPLKEQQRIVDKIESLFEKLDKAKELIEEARDDFENRKKNILRDAFVGKLTRNYRSRNNFKSNAYDLIKDIRNELEQWYKEECITAKLVGNKKPRKLNFDIQKSEFEYLFKEIPLTWRVSYFQEIIEPVDNALKAGPFGSSLKKSMYVEKGYKIYGQEQVISGNISYGDYYINEEKFNELKSCEVREGDLLISLVGTIGKTLIMPKEYEKGIINPRLLKISVNKKISAEYIKMYFESPIAKYIMSEKSHGGTMEILNLDIIKKLPIPIPPIEEQIEIVRILDKIFEEESKIEELTQLEEQIELIKKSILAKAFRGQLGTNCEDDKSALELLKEIIE